jgi:hypothetical protein
MSSANCPFSIFPKKEDLDSIRRKDRYITINIPLNPSDPNSQKITHEYHKLNSTEVEDILEFFSVFDDVVKTLALSEGSQRFRLIPAMMAHDPQKKWFDIVANHGTNQTQVELENCIERFLLLFMEEDISLDIKEWMSEVKKPRSMSVQDFVQRLTHLNNLIEYTPISDPISNPNVQTPKFTDTELARIVCNACPAGWKKAQVQANLRHWSLTAQTRYYTRLKSVEPSDLVPHCNRNDSKGSNPRKNQNSQGNNKAKSEANPKTAQTQKYFEVHGMCNYTISQCEVVQKQRNEYREQSRNKDNKNNNNPRYNTRSTTKKQSWGENNNLTINSRSEENSVGNSEINHIKEIFCVQEELQNNNKESDDISTEIRVQGSKKNVDHILLGLLDTGATGIFVKRMALKNIDHHLKEVNIQVKGRYAHSHLKQVAFFNIQLPDFCHSRSISIKAYVEEESIGRHDIVLGTRFILQLGLVFDFKRCAVYWDELSIPMRNKGSITPEELTTVNDTNLEAPILVQKAVQRLEKMIIMPIIINQWY